MGAEPLAKITEFSGAGLPNHAPIGEVQAATNPRNFRDLYASSPGKAGGSPASSCDQTPCPRQEDGRCLSEEESEKALLSI